MSPVSRYIDVCTKQYITSTRNNEQVYVIGDKRGQV